MRTPVFACAFVVALSCAGTAQARVSWGSGDEIVHLCNLPPEIRAELKEQVGVDLAVGYLYEHWFLFADGFDFWTWNGRYVLFRGDKYWPLTEEGLADLIGKEPFAALSKPLAYRFPAGLLTVLGIVAAASISFYFSAEGRGSRLAKDKRYLAAFEVYAQSLPGNDVDPTWEEINGATALGVEFLQ